MSWAYGSDQQIASDLNDGQLNGIFAEVRAEIDRRNAFWTRIQQAISKGSLDGVASGDLLNLMGRVEAECVSRGLIEVATEAANV